MIQVHRFDSIGQSAAAAVLALGMQPTWAQEADPLQLRLPPDAIVVPVPKEQTAMFKAMDAEVDALLKLPEARRDFDVTGAGVAVVVLDSGLRLTHRDFASRVSAWHNFTDEGDPEDVSDLNGHGTNVAGIIAAEGRFAPRGVAPGCSIIPLKVIRKDGSGDFQWMLAALDWTIKHAKDEHIGAVSMSLGNPENYQTLEQALANANARATFDVIRQRIQALTQSGIVVVIAAGNDYFRSKAEGMSFPAIVSDCISVGAVYDSTILGTDGQPAKVGYLSGAVARTTGPDRLTPFTQRLHSTTNATGATDVFAPGAPITSAGAQADDGLSVQSGTSQATPVVTGLVLLIEDYFITNAKRRPTSAEIVECLNTGSQPIIDGDDEDDNVPHSQKRYGRVSPAGALAVARSIVGASPHIALAAHVRTDSLVKFLQEQRQLAPD